MNKDAYYFPHDSNATNDPKIMLLIAEWGLEAYGIFWTLIEHLRDQPNYRSHMNVVKALAFRYNSTEEKYKSVINDFDLFIIENDDFFYSESLIQRMVPLEKKREQRKLAGIESAKKRKEKRQQQKSTVVATTAQRSLERSLERPLNDRSTPVESRCNESQRPFNDRSEPAVYGQDGNQRLSNDRSTTVGFRCNEIQQSKVKKSKVKKSKEEENKEENKEEKNISIFDLKNEKYLEKVNDFLKSEFINISFEDLKKEAEIFIEKKIVTTDTGQSFYEYANHFINTIKKKYKSKEKAPTTQELLKKYNKK